MRHHLSTLWRLSILLLIASSILASSTLAQPLYTGLIIDARGLGIVPGMSPKVYAFGDHIIYGHFDYINKDFVIREGIALYADTIENATELHRAGNYPLIIKAKSKGCDPFGASMIVSNEDAVKILSADDTSNFLSTFHVTIVL